MAVGFDCGLSEEGLRNINSWQNLPFPLVFDGEKKIYGMYGAGGVSTYLILDELGMVRYRQSGLDQRSLLSTMHSLLTD